MAIDDRMILKREVEAITQLSGSTIYRLQRAGNFPRYEQISVRRVAIRQSILTLWLDGKRDWASE